MSPHAAVARQPLDARVLARLACAYALATNGTILMPLIVGVLMRRYALGEGEATAVAGLEIAGIAFACALLPHRIARRARRYALLATLGAIAAQAACIAAPNATAAGALRALAGLFEGMLFVVVAACLAQREDAERAWGIVILGAGIVDGLLLLALAALPDETAAHWFFGALAAAFVPLALPSARAGEGAVDVVGAARARRPWRTLLPLWTAMVLAYGVLAAQWAVADLVGRRSGLTPAMSGLLLSLASVFGIAGCLAAAHRASPAHRGVIVSAAQLVMAASALWFFAGGGAFAFFASQWLITLAFYALTPFISARLSSLDEDGSLVARSVVVCFASVAVGTAAAGGLLTSLGAVGLGVLLAGCAAAGMPFARAGFASIHHPEESR